MRLRPLYGGTAPGIGSPRISFQAPSLGTERAQRIMGFMKAFHAQAFPAPANTVSYAPSSKTARS